MKHFRFPLLLEKSLEKLCANLREDLYQFWPASEREGEEGREMHEGNMILHLGAIFKNRAHIYTQVSTDDYPRRDIDFMALPYNNEDWFLICEAKRGYTTNQIKGISGDIKRIVSTARGKKFQEKLQEFKFSKAYGLLLITLWTRSEKRALMKAWEDNLEVTNESSIARACRDVIRKLENHHAKRVVRLIRKYGKDKHYLLYAVFEINLY